MKACARTIVGIVCASPVSAAQAVQATPPAAPPPTTSPTVAKDAMDLSILYAGFPGGEREQQFVEFLEAWFPEVKTIDLQALSSETAAAFDVVIADWKPRYKDGNYVQGSDPSVRLDADYAKPTVCIGAVGSTICGGKLDWL